MTTTDGWLKLSFASHVTRKTRSLGALVNIYTFHLYHTGKRQKKKSVTAGLYEDPDRLVVVKKRGCDWGACGRPRRPCHLASAARTAAARADPHAGEALAAEGYRWAQASRRDEA